MLTTFSFFFPIQSFVSRGDKGEVVKTDTCGCNGTEKERSECKKTT